MTLNNMEHCFLNPVAVELNLKKLLKKLIFQIIKNLWLRLVLKEFYDFSTCIVVESGQPVTVT